MSTRRPKREEAPAGMPVCPSHLVGEAREEWGRMSGKLFACGLLTEIDGAALALYCQAWGRWVEAEKKLLEYGTVVKAQSGALAPSPYLAIANKAMDQMTKLLTEFGMSPSSRTRVSIAPPTEGQPAPARNKDEPDPRHLLRMVQ